MIIMIEDVRIALGQAIKEAVGSKKGNPALWFYASAYGQVLVGVEVKLKKWS